VYDAAVARLLAPWLRRAIEAAVVASVVAITTLLGDQLTGPGRPALMTGPAGALRLAPGVLALGVVTVAYPVAMAATRSDALLGAISGFLLASDLTILFTGALFVVALASLPALVGLLASQVATPLGFGRRAGAGAAVTGALIALVILAVVATR